MTRRSFVASTSAAATLASTPPPSKVKLGIDLFSLRATQLSPFAMLDYCAAQRVEVVHFSEIRFLGGLDPGHLRKVRQHAAHLHLELEIGMKSICPTSTTFEAAQGTASEQLNRMLDAARLVGSPLVRAVLGTAEDRHPPGIEKRIADTVATLKSVRSRAQDNNLRIAIENHAGDMQARELKMLVEEAGPECVGVCLDSGNPLWTIEDPHLTLETLHPYVLTSHLRDSMVWETPQGAAVTWVPMGRGNVDIARYVKRFAELCPGKPLSLESIVFGPRLLPYRHPDFWQAYRSTPAWEFERFTAIAVTGHPYPDEPWQTADEPQREKTALEESLAYTRKLI